MATRRQPLPPASITFHFDGPITVDHQVTLRTLGKTLDHLQNAVDRSYLDLKYHNVIKHQRLKKNEYADVDFFVRPPTEGGFVMDLVSSAGREIVDRLSSATARAYEADIIDAEQEHQRLLEQADMRRRVYETTGKAVDFNEFVYRESDELARAYGDRAIVKEIDQILSLIRTPRYEGSTFELSAFGSRSHPVLAFDEEKARQFHAVVSERRVGEPILLQMQLRSLDAGRENQVAHGKGRNLTSGKEFNFLVPSPMVFDRMARYLRRRRRQAIRVVACPVYEYNAFDPSAGDMIIIDFEGNVDA